MIPRKYRTMECRMKKDRKTERKSTMKNTKPDDLTGWIESSY